MSRDVYKVTGAAVEKTRRGFDVFCLHLEERIRATQLIPLKEMEGNTNKIYKHYKLNNFSLDSLVGKYVSLRLEETKYGFQFSDVISCDVVGDFKRLLDKANGKAFHTDLDVCKILIRNGYAMNANKSITLKAEYRELDIIRKNETIICYPNWIDGTYLSVENIETIYNYFYKGKEIDTMNSDIISEYCLHSAAIVEFRCKYHKDNGKLLSRDYLDVIRVGDRLSQAQMDYLLQGI